MTRRRETASIGAASRPELVIIQPSATRFTAICSDPSARPLKKTVKVVAFVSGSGGGSGTS